MGELNKEHKGESIEWFGCEDYYNSYNLQKSWRGIEVFFEAVAAKEVDEWLANILGGTLTDPFLRVRPYEEAYTYWTEKRQTLIQRKMILFEKDHIYPDKMVGDYKEDVCTFIEDRPSAAVFLQDQNLQDDSDFKLCGPKSNINLNKVVWRLFFLGLNYREISLHPDVIESRNGQSISQQGVRKKFNSLSNKNHKFRRVFPLSQKKYTKAEVIKDLQAMHEVFAKELHKISSIDSQKFPNFYMIYRVSGNLSFINYLIKFLKNPEYKIYESEIWVRIIAFIRIDCQVAFWMFYNQYEGYSFKRARMHWLRFHVGISVDLLKDSFFGGVTLLKCERDMLKLLGLDQVLILAPDLSTRKLLKE